MLMPDTPNPRVKAAAPALSASAKPALAPASSAASLGASFERIEYGPAVAPAVLPDSVSFERIAYGYVGHRGGRHPGVGDCGSFRRHHRCDGIRLWQGHWSRRSQDCRDLCWRLDYFRGRRCVGRTQVQAQPEHLGFGPSASIATRHTQHKCPVLKQIKSLTSSCPTRYSGFVISSLGCKSLRLTILPATR